MSTANVVAFCMNTTSDQEAEQKEEHEATVAVGLRNPARACGRAAPVVVVCGGRVSGTPIAISTAKSIVVAPSPTKSQKNDFAATSPPSVRPIAKPTLITQ